MGTRVRITPADIHNRVFGKSPLGKRGYDEEEVDGLLDEVTQEMIRLLEENERLRQQSGREPAPQPGPDLRGELAAAGERLDRARRAYDGAERRARETQQQLAAARRAAAEAPALSAPSGPDVQRVLAMAQRTADDHMRDAERESATLLAESRERSDQVIRESIAKAEALESDARRDYDRSIAGVEADRRRALADIEGLTTLAGQYKAGLREHIARQRSFIDNPDA